MPSALPRHHYPIQVYLSYLHRRVHALVRTPRVDSFLMVLLTDFAFFFDLGVM